MADKRLLFIRENTVMTNGIFVRHHQLALELDAQGFFWQERFTFVGVFYSAATAITVIGYPKYYPEPDALTHELQQGIIIAVGRICELAARAVRALPKSVKESDYLFDTLPETAHQHWATPFELAQFILDDYLNYGPYVERTTLYGEHSHGQIDWLRTVGSTASVAGRDIWFPHPIRRVSAQSSPVAVSRLHLWILHECLELLSSIGLYQDVEPPDFVHAMAEEDIKAAVADIQKMLLHVYSERKILLLHALKAWCEMTEHQRSRFGITSFEMVWEYSTKQVFGNIEKTGLARPSYVVDGVAHQGKGSPTPDIIRAERAQAGRLAYLGILDAKYYCPVCCKGAIKGAPNSADVAKQIGYLHLLRQLHPHPDILYCNCFLLPALPGEVQGLYRYIGLVKSEEKQNPDIAKNLGSVAAKIEDHVLLYKVNPDELFGMCLAGKTLSSNQFYADFVVPHQPSKNT